MNYHLLLRAYHNSTFIKESLTSSVTVFCSGLSIKFRLRVPGAVRLVRIIQFLGLPHHCTNSSREKPHSISGTLASTTWMEIETNYLF